MTAAAGLLKPPTPPPSARRFRSDDLDEVRSFIGRTDGEHSRVVRGTGPLGFEVAASSGGLTRVGWGRVALPQTVRGALREACIHVSIDAGSHYGIGKRRYDIAAGQAMFVAGGAEFTRSSPPGTVFAIGVSASALLAEAEARRPGARGDWTLLTRPIGLRDRSRLALGSAMADLPAALDPACPAPQRGLREAQFVAALVDVLQLEPAMVLAPMLSARRVADLEGWIDAHLGDPITLGRLCEVAGVGQRSLQLGFECRRGLSPMQFVAERRLAAAHRCLLQAGPGASVTAIATQVGFSHLGRFAGMYLHAYGETPSQTLRRRVPPEFAFRIAQARRP
jgi:AraC-like DNA-binding protein